MHRLSTSFVLAYHGCDRELGEALLAGDQSFLPSNNDYDWLGPGVYFWESNPHRAFEFAREKFKRRQGVTSPFVVGAVIDLGLCLDLTTKVALESLRTAYSTLHEDMQTSGASMPENGPEPWRRSLDCAVIQYLHHLLRCSNQNALDTVRGIFTEGRPLYPGSGFLEKTHVQISVVNLACIKAIFRVPKSEYS